MRAESVFNYPSTLEINHKYFSCNINETGRLLNQRIKEPT